MALACHHVLLLQPTAGAAAAAAPVAAVASGTYLLEALEQEVVQQWAHILRQRRMVVLQADMTQLSTAAAYQQPALRKLQADTTQPSTAQQQQLTGTHMQGSRTSAA
jgi:Skp family chaperone for outer membrane proteins